jgi:signal recognition particle receptor subunit beta
LLSADPLLNVDLLVFANKQDLPHAMSVDAIVDQLGLRGLQRTWHIQVSRIDLFSFFIYEVARQPTCAVSGDGLHEGLEWLSKRM